MLGIGVAGAGFDVELGLLLIFGVLGVGVDALSLELLLDELALYQALGFLEVVHRADNL